jgi:hypothetical protein
MPDTPSQLQAIISWSIRWCKYPAVLVVTVILWDLITIVVHPTDVQLMNATVQGVAFLSTPMWWWNNSTLIILLIASIIIGFLAQRQVNRAQDETAKLVDLCRKFKDQLVKKQQKSTIISIATAETTHSLKNICPKMTHDNTIEDRLLLNEVTEMLKEYDKK